MAAMGFRSSEEPQITRASVATDCAPRPFRQSRTAPATMPEPADLAIFIAEPKGQFRLDRKTGWLVSSPGFGRGEKMAVVGRGLLFWAGWRSGMWSEGGTDQPT